MKIPLFIPWISKKDKKMMFDAFKSIQLTDGPKLRKFESRFANLVNSKFALGVSSGTSALHLALKAVGIGSRDEVIIPDLTFVATANAVLSCNAKPIPADVDESLNICPNSIRSKINKKTKAIIPVHFAGSTVNMQEIKKIAKRYNLKIIEDCAHALGAFYGKKHVGTFGEAGCFSFYPTKNITTVEGGMVITNSRTISEKISKLRNHGINKTLIERHMGKIPWTYDISDYGYNYRLDEVRSSLGLSQLARFKKISSKRIKAANYYNKKLKNIEGIEIPLKYNKNNHVYHLYIIKIKKKFGIERNRIHLELIKKNIFTTVHYKPIHKFSYFKQFNFKDKDFPNTMNAYKECLTLPLFPLITRKQQDYVIDSLLKLQK